MSRLLDKRRRLALGCVILLAVALISVILTEAATKEVKSAAVKDATPAPAAMDEQAKLEALRSALGVKAPGEPEPAPVAPPEPEPVKAPEFEVKATPPEEHATYLEARLARITEEEKALEALRADVQKEIKKLEEVRATIDARLAQEDEVTAKKVNHLLSIYDKMRIEELAKVLQKLPDDLMIKVLFHMKEKRVSAILEKMDSGEAAKVSKALLNKTTK